MSTLTEFDLIVDLESTVVCEEKDCDNPVEWIRRHENCRRLVCSECRAYTLKQFFMHDLDEPFWCSVCELSEPLRYWIEEVRWLPLG